MTILLPNLRYERKFLCERFSLAQVLVMVRHHPALFREVFPPRTVNNIYLDSPGLRDYFAHVNGVANRAKTRIRWYGPLGGQIEKPALERKLKRGLVSGKLTYPLPPLAFHRGVSFSQMESALASEAVDRPLRAALQQLRPSLVNRYQRRYFLSADGRFRLTIDWDLQFWPALAFPMRRRPSGLANRVSSSS